MIISHKYKFIFIKTVKTAGTSIEVFLSQCCGENDVVTPIYPHVEPHFARNYKGLWNPFPEIIEKQGRGIRKTVKQLTTRKKFFRHINARTIKSRISPKIWNNYFKFCVERNPWDKTLSHYYMVNDRMGGCMTFEEYLNKGNFCCNYPIYMDKNEKLLVDEVIKYENLMEDLAGIFGKLAMPFEGSLGIRAKSEHRKDRRCYQEVYSAEQKDVIAKAFAKEIHMHGYSF